MLHINTKSHFSTFICSLLQLTIVCRLLDKIENCSSQFGRSQGIRLRCIAFLFFQIYPSQSYTHYGSLIEMSEINKEGNSRGTPYYIKLGPSCTLHLKELILVLRCLVLFFSTILTRLPSVCRVDYVVIVDVMKDGYSFDQKATIKTSWQGYVLLILILLPLEYVA